MTKKVNSVDEYLEANSYYSDALSILRDILNSTELEETIKWSAPTYCINGKNVIGMAAFKHHFCLWFHQGVFLKDKHNLLVNAQEGKTKALRQMRFENLEDLNTDLVLEYIKEAIDNQHKDKVYKTEKNTKAVIIPEALNTILNNDQDLQLAFSALTPGRQRDYCEYISSAKRETTKLARLEKITPMILNGIGLYDKYKNC